MIFGKITNKINKGYQPSCSTLLLPYPFGNFLVETSVNLKTIFFKWYDYFYKGWCFVNVFGYVIRRLNYLWSFDFNNTTPLPWKYILFCNFIFFLQVWCCFNLVFGRNMVKYTQKVSVYNFTLYHPYKSKQIA